MIEAARVAEWTIRWWCSDRATSLDKRQAVDSSAYIRFRFGDVSAEYVVSGGISHGDNYDHLVRKRSLSPLA